MAVVTRTRRAAIQREAARIRRDGQRNGYATRRIAAAVRAALPEVTALEAWRLALGWSRAEAIAQVAACYHAEGLGLPGMNESMLCRWEHDPRERPSAEYAVMIARAYGASPEELGLTRRHLLALSAPAALRYGRDDDAMPLTRGEPPMTTAAGLPAVKESLRLALLADPGVAGPAVPEAAAAAAEHYALNYSRHPPHVLFGGVRAARELLTAPLSRASDRQAIELHRTVGRLSALMGNVAYHLADHSGAQVHLTAAAGCGARVGDVRLVAWTCGARSMVARSRGQTAVAVELAERGVAAAQGPLARAQLLGWALLPSLAAQGRAREAEDARRRADEAFAAAEEQPGRFGYDGAEHRLHAAEACIALGRVDQARPLAMASADACTPGTPGWAAATLLLARVEAAAGEPADAAARATAVLESVPAGRLRSTARARLAALDRCLHDVAEHRAVRELRDAVRALPAFIDSRGRASAGER